MVLAQTGDERVDLGCLRVPGGELSHRSEAPCCPPVVLRVGGDQFMFDQPLVDREHGQRIDLLVRLCKLNPDEVVVEPELVRLLPGEARIVECAERKEQIDLPCWPVWR